MEDGCIFRIDNLTVVYPSVITNSLKRRRDIELKFCVRDDDEFKNIGDIEHWELVLFPKFDKDGVEIAHGAIVSYDDSVVNRNLTVEDCVVTERSTNQGMMSTKKFIIQY